MAAGAVAAVLALGEDGALQDAVAAGDRDGRTPLLAPQGANNRIKTSAAEVNGGRVL